MTSKRRPSWPNAVTYAGRGLNMAIMSVMPTIKPTAGGFPICSGYAYKLPQGQSACVSVRAVYVQVRYKRRPKRSGVPLATPGILPDALGGEHPSQSLNPTYDLVKMFDVSDVYGKIK